MPEPALDELLIEEALPEGHRSGFVAVVGRPNVGKSTLMNAYLGQKIAIVSPKPQTTRNRLLGILTREDAQIIFVDTPGYHQPKHKLGEFMIHQVEEALPDADVVLWLVDVSVLPRDEDRLIAERLQETDVPSERVLMGLNKADLLRSEHVIPHTEAYEALLPGVESLLISATRGDNRDLLLQMIVDRLPEGPRYFPPDQVTDQQERFIAAELIREAALHFLHQEVPHGVAVVVEEFKRRSDEMTYIGATLYVERESHKGIVLGQGGRMLKRIGQKAREEIEQLVGTRVYLDLWVKVQPRWRKDEAWLRRLGYPLPQKRR